jgi:serine/threonine protein kinase
MEDRIRAALVSKFPQLAEGPLNLMHIGSGAVSEVYRLQFGTYDFALKWMRSVRLDPMADVEGPLGTAKISSIENEVQIHSHLSHLPSVVKYRGYVHNINDHFLIMDYLSGYMTLLMYVTTHRLLMASVKTIVNQLVQGLQAIHKEGVAHRDIKPDNILIHPETLDVKFIDLGLAKMEATTGIAGTLYYKPPEYAEAKTTYSLEAMQQGDIWSLGLTIYRLVAKDDYTILWYTFDFWKKHGEEFMKGFASENVAFQHYHAQAIESFIEQDSNPTWSRYLPDKFAEFHPEIYTCMLAMLKRNPEERRLEVIP